MTGRDRTVMMVVGVVALLAAAWLLALSPKRKDIKDLDAKITAAQTRLTAAQGTVAQAKAAKATYRHDYATVARLGKAVPADADVPSLVFQLQSAARRAKVDFQSVTSIGALAAAAPVAQTNGAQVAALAAAQKGTDTTPAATTPAATTPAATTPAATTDPAASPATPAATTASGLQTLPFQFQFKGRFFGLEDYLDEIARFTVTKKGNVIVRGRLLTLDAFELAPVVESTVPGQAPTGVTDVTATISATAYVVPAATAAAVGTPPTPGAPATSTAGTTTAATTQTGTAR